MCGRQRKLTEEVKSGPTGGKGADVASFLGVPQVTVSGSHGSPQALLSRVSAKANLLPAMIRKDASLLTECWPAASLNKIVPCMTNVF